MGDLTDDFSRREFKCKCGCGIDTVDYELVVALQDVRDHFGMPITITSGYRCEKHNRNVGGAETSQHLYGRAADFVVDGVAAHKVQDYLVHKYKDKWGIGYGVTFTHLDTRSGPKARWSY